MTLRYHAGVDPGLSGAIALLEPASGDLIVFDMPTHELKRGKTAKRHIDVYQLGTFFDLHASSIIRAVVENPHSMPGQGVSSSFAFGFNCGVAQMALAANMVSMVLVPPAVWKRHMGLSADKDASRALASRLLPKHSGKWARAKDDGRAEAALLAIYGSKMQ